jgi:hypothetical protein
MSLLSTTRVWFSNVCAEATGSKNSHSGESRADGPAQVFPVIHNFSRCLLKVSAQRGRLTPEAIRQTAAFPRTYGKRRELEEWLTKNRTGSGITPLDGRESEGVIEARLRELAQFGSGETHLVSGGIFGGQVGVEHGWIVCRKHNGNAMAQKLRERVVEQRGALIELPGQRAGSEIADRTNFQRDTTVREQVHERSIMDGGDAVADTFDGENLDGFADFFRATDFAGVHQPMQSRGGSRFIHGKKILGGDTQFVAADAEGDDSGRSAIFGGLDHAHGGRSAKLADSVKNPAQGEAPRLERFGGTQDGCEVGFGFLVAQEHYSYRESDFGVDNLVLKELFAKIVSDQRVVRRIAKIGSDPLEGVEEAEEIGVAVAMADFGLAGGNTVACGEGGDSGRLNGTFEVKVEFGFGELAN